MRNKSWGINNGSLTQQNKELFDKISEKKNGKPST